MPAMVGPSSSTTDLQGLPLGLYTARGYRAPLPSILSRILYPSNGALVLFWAEAVAVALATLAVVGLGRRTWVVPLLGILTCIPHTIVVFIGSDTSIGRHGILMSVLLRLSVILGTLYVLEALLANRGATARAQPTAKIT